jgi:DNA-binding NtrC family response regulator
MSHVGSGYPPAAHRHWSHARTGHRCLVEEVLRGMSRPALGSDDGRRPLSEALERALRRQLPAQWVRIRALLEGTAARSNAGGDAEQGIVRVPVPTRGGGLRWVLEVGLTPGQSLTEEHWQAIHRAAGVWELAAEMDRKGGVLPRVLPAQHRVRDGAAPLIGGSSAMCRLRERIERVAATDFTVLIEGESGSGKELVARQIHDLSVRRRSPFVALNCAAIVDSLLEAELFGIEDRTATGVRGRRGKFEHASGGTLFLDEVADLSASAQAKLLRAIQERAVERVGAHDSQAVDIRLVVATNRPLRDLVQQGVFRTDLFYRLSGIDLQVPPLRSRREDVLELAHYFLIRHGRLRTLGLSAAAENALFSYEWPGNVRELERMMESAVVLAKGSQIELQDLPPEVRGEFGDVIDSAVSGRETLREWGSRYVRLVLHRCGNNKRAACRILDISYHTLQGYLKDAGPPEACTGGEPDELVWPSPSAAAVVHEDRAPMRESLSSGA